MSNPNNPFGFRYDQGSSYSASGGTILTFPIDPTVTQTLSEGDLVLLTGGYITRALPFTGTTVPILGTFQGAVYDSADVYDSPNGFWSGPQTGVTNVQARVLVEPFAVFSAQMSGAGLVLTDVGKNFNFTATANTSPYGNSNYTVTSGSGDTVTANLPLKCVGLAPGYNFGDSYNVGLFIINTPRLGNNTVGA